MKKTKATDGGVERRFPDLEIHAGRDSIDQEIWWEPKKGQSSIWYDNWTQLGALHYYLPISRISNSDMEDVNQLMNQGEWDNDILLQLFPELVIKQIYTHIKVIGDSDDWDKPWWMLASTGRFKVGFSWEVLRQRGEPQLEFNHLWLIGIPFKVSFFLWRL